MLFPLDSLGRPAVVTGVVMSLSWLRCRTPSQPLCWSMLQRPSNGGAIGLCLKANALAAVNVLAGDTRRLEFRPLHDEFKTNSDETMTYVLFVLFFFRGRFYHCSSCSKGNREIGGLIPAPVKAHGEA